MTATDENPGHKALQDQFAGRVYEGYKNRSQEFNNTFGILLAFAVIFMLLIQVPYTLIKSQQAAADRRLQDLAGQTRLLDRKIKLYSQVLQGVDELRAAMRSGPEKLRSKIRDLAQQKERAMVQSNVPQFQARQQQQQQQQQQQLQQQLQPQHRCGEVQNEQWLNCEVQAVVGEQFDEFEAILNRDILNTLQNLAEAGESIDTQNVQQGLNQLQNEFWNTLQKNREFWLTFSGKMDFFDQLHRLLDRFWSTHGTNIEEKARRLKTELEKLETERTDLQEQKDQLLKTAAAVEKRISSIESPFGKLPVGMAESIALFPVIIAFGFALAAGKLNSAMALRREIFRLWRSQDPQQQLLSDEQINLIAPLGVAPVAQGHISPGKIALLLLPLALYILACALIVYTWGGTTAVNEEDLMDGLKPIYAALYIASAVVMAVSYWKIFKNMFVSGDNAR